MDIGFFSKKKQCHSCCVSCLLKEILGLAELLLLVVTWTSFLRFTFNWYIYLSLWIGGSLFSLTIFYHGVYE